MTEKVNLEQSFAKLTETFTPKIVAELNGQHVKVALLEGDKVPLHVHEHEDELFWVVEGTLDVEVEGELTTLLPGELCIVERGRAIGPGPTTEVARADILRIAPGQLHLPLGHTHLDLS